MKQSLTSRVALMLATICLATTSGTVSADSSSAFWHWRGQFHDKVTSTWQWRTGTTQRRGSTDIAFRKTGGTNPAIDMRWVKCSNPSVHGPTVYNIRTGKRRIIGKNLSRTMCFKLQYRGYQKPNGTFVGYLYFDRK